jgi:hypothetical protein
VAYVWEPSLVKHNLAALAGLKPGDKFSIGPKGKFEVQKKGLLWGVWRTLTAGVSLLDE